MKITDAQIDELGGNVGLAMARELLRKGRIENWQGIDSLAGNQFLMAGLRAESPEWFAAERAAAVAFRAAMESAKMEALEAAAQEIAKMEALAERAG